MLTFFNNVIDICTGIQSHEAKKGENNETGKHASETVDQWNNHCIPANCMHIRHKSANVGTHVQNNMLTTYELRDILDAFHIDNSYKRKIKMYINVKLIIIMEIIMCRSNIKA